MMKGTQVLVESSRIGGLFVRQGVSHERGNKFTVADPGFPVGGRGPPMQALFGKNVCENERIGSWGGACAGHASLDLPMVYTQDLCHFFIYTINLCQNSFLTRNLCRILCGIIYTISRDGINLGIK